MIDLGATVGGRLVTTIDSRVLEQATIRRRAAESIVRAIASRLPAGSLRFPIESLAATPHAHGLAAFSAGHLNPERGELLLSRLLEMPATVVERVNGNHISLLQDSALLPTAETRSAQVVLAALEESPGTDALDCQVGRIIAAAGPAWHEFVTIVRAVTFVEIEGRPGLPYFSGSTSDFWGAIHLSVPRSDAVLAEALTHEAAHLWLMLAEDLEPLCADAWRGTEWDSPWRDDPRPLGGIVHGTFVFSCASLALAALVRAGVAGDEVPARIARITAQVEAAARECERSGALAPLGSSVVSRALERICQARAVISHDLVNDARLRVAQEQECKRSRRNAAAGTNGHA